MALDVDLATGADRIRELKVPVPPDLARDLEMVHWLREASRWRVKEPLWRSVSRIAARPPRCRRV